MSNVRENDTTQQGRYARNASFFLVAALWLALDRITKAAAVSALKIPGTNIDLIDGVLRFNLVYNRGAAWGIFSDSTLALGVFSVVLCVLILVFLLKSGMVTTSAHAIALALVFGGGLGNAIDRFAYGRVTDFIEAIFIDFPVFNVADIGVTCGVIAFLILLIRDMVLEARASKASSLGDGDE